MIEPCYIEKIELPLITVITRNYSMSLLIDKVHDYPGLEDELEIIKENDHVVFLNTEKGILSYDGDLNFDKTIQIKKAMILS